MVEFEDADFFLSELEEYKEFVRQEALNVFREISSETFIKIAKRTPVRTGSLISAWDIEINKQGRGKAGVRGITKQTGISLAKGRTGKLHRLKITDTVYITNNMSYAHIVEYGLYRPGPNTTPDGYSRQAPHGMVRVTLAEMRMKYAEYLKRTFGK